MRINFPIIETSLKDKIKNMSDEEIRAQIVAMRQERVASSLAEGNRTRRKIREFKGEGESSPAPKRGRASLRLITDEGGDQ